MNKVSNNQVGTVYPFLDARTPKSNSDLLPVKLSVNLKGEQFRIGLKIDATRELFDKATAGRGTIPKEAKLLKGQIDEYLQKARNILEQFPHLNRKTFINLFKSENNLKTSNKTCLTALFQLKINELVEEDKAGSIAFYTQSLVVLKSFRKDFYLEDITVELLKSFRAWYINQGNSNATVQIHLRSLRHIYNRAIKQGYISQAMYPFKEFTIGTTSKSKDVLYPSQLKELWEYKPRTMGEERAKDYFFFLYLSNGMNIKDALSLKGMNIKGGMITFMRAKTSKTKVDSKEIMVYLHPEMKRIMQTWGTLKTKDYIFPCFLNTSSDIQRKRLKDIFARNLNRDLRKIGERLKFEIHLTLNLARHSFATRLKLDGTPIGFISDAMGHSSSKTTEHYIKSLPDDKYKTISEGLLNF